ncbi:hypothetical protein KUTeg_003541 [Tegillarca granosa]|uniref:Uncharacterized protein n=1 Tax=Tegillarca granosa TaxID=220873 RepID=A0ABQ9FRV1_TEGGR|nr:hypothetical protein KUTeg_003541 [Tegillarca granosa]
MLVVYDFGFTVNECTESVSEYIYSNVSSLINLKFCKLDDFTLELLLSVKYVRHIYKKFRN